MSAVTVRSSVRSTLWQSSRPLRERRFGDPATEAVSRELVSETLLFLETLADASASTFFWISSDYHFIEGQLRNFDREMVSLYETELRDMDPLQVSRLEAERRTIAILSGDETLKRSIPSAYWKHIQSVGVGDELALILWYRDRPFGYLSLYRGPTQPRFSPTENDWSAIHRYIEASLSQHFRFRYAQTEHCLSERFHLNPREIDVVEQILQGKANVDISEILDISLATVKAHVGSILRKMGVDSRLAIACVVNHIQK